MERHFRTGSALAVATIIACVLLAFPAAAADTTYPVLDNQVTTRQAHIAWQGALFETKMQATIDYITSLNGDTSQLSSILSQFQGRVDQAPTLTTNVGLDSLVRDMADLVRQFRAETLTQLKASRGKAADLKVKIDAAVSGNPQIATLEATYWSTRETDRLANFDTQTARAQKVLDTLKGKGYDTSTAQATLDQITGKRSDLESALASHDNTQIQSVNQAIEDLWKTLGQQVKDLQVKVTDAQKDQYWINAGERAMGRVDMIDSDLKTLGVDTSTIDPLVTTAKSDLSSAQSAYASGDLNGAKTGLQTFRDDLKSLRDAYRALVGSGKVSGNAARDVQSLATALDSTATQMAAIT
ncbi:MAG TPA: hypothetical protein VLU98_02855 [Methanomicrobiales archaeon]|nr:hypothetical protein [Methanomicrobiales archaeon]